jgi:hypothetical protein
MENLNHTSTPQSTTHRIATLDEHRQALKYVLKTARERVIIISPSVSRYEMRQDDVAGLVRAAVSRGVVVSVITDDKQNRINGEMKNVARAGFLELLQAGARVTIRDGIQYKILIKDNNLIAKGNFLWLSAARQGEKVKKAFSVITAGESARTMIADELHELDKRPAAEVSIKGQGPERGNKGAKGETSPSWDPASARPRKAAMVLAWIVFMICVTGIWGSSGFAVVCIMTIIIGPIILLIKPNRKPFPKSNSVFTDEELGIGDPPKKKEEWGGNYSLTGPDYNSQNLFNLD